jgi:hypothetical protein
MSFGEYENLLIDAPTHSFYFMTSFCNYAQNAEEAWVIGIELLSLYNGTMSLLNPSLYPLKITELVHNDANITPINSHLISPKDFLLLDPIFSGHKEVAMPFYQPTDFSEGIRAAVKNHDVYLILKLFSFEHNWVTAYKILETLESLMKRDGFPPAFSKANRDKIAMMANNFSATGFVSRHGFKAEEKVISNKKVIDISEAFQMLRMAARPYYLYLIGKQEKSVSEEEYPITNFI